MSDTTTTTTSEPRPVSALEQTLIGIIDRLDPLLDQDTIIVYGNVAKLVHERDAPLFKLLHYCEHTATAPALTDGAEYTRGYKTALADIAEELHNILEGRAQP